MFQSKPSTTNNFHLTDVILEKLSSFLYTFKYSAELNGGMEKITVLDHLEEPSPLKTKETEEKQNILFNWMMEIYEKHGFPHQGTGPVQTFFRHKDFLNSNNPNTLMYPDIILYLDWMENSDGKEFILKLISETKYDTLLTHGLITHCIKKKRI